MVTEISHNRPDTAELVRQAQKEQNTPDSACAFDTIVRQFQDTAVGYATALLNGDFAAAQDVAQDAFLEAYRTLPALRCPPAFPGWLRLLVRKHCDRRRRGPEQRTPLLPLESAWSVAGPANVLATVLHKETQAQVQQALRSLPDGERAVVVLFYLGGQSLGETAQFLEIPVTVVKNRLYRARKRLKERMVDLMAETLDEKRPSKDDAFRDRVFVRLQNEFVEQYRRDPETANHALLQQSRDEFERYLADGGPLDADAMRFGCRLYTTLSEYTPFIALLERYRRQELPLVEKAWAWHEYIRSLAALRRCEEVIREQRQFTIWAETHLPGSPPIRLSSPGIAGWVPPDSILPWVVNIMEVTRCFRNQGLQTEWAATVRRLVRSVPQVRINRLHRFWALRCLVVMYYGTAEDLPLALGAIEDIRALADEENDWESPRWPIEAAYMRMIASSEAGETINARAAAEEATRLLEEYAPKIDTANPAQIHSYQTLCDNVASPLADREFPDLAVRLFPRVLENGNGTGWAYVRYAASIWQTTGDREKTLELLRRGAARKIGDSLLYFFQTRAAFADVKDDPEFAAAISGTTP